MSDEYVLDRNFDRLYVGDYVRAVVDHYQSVRRGEQRRIYGIRDGCIILHNDQRKWPHQTSPFHPANFILAGRHHAWHKTQEAQVANKVYVAFPIEEGQNYEDYAGQLIAHSLDVVDASTNYEMLKRRLEDRIKRDPSRRYMIFGGSTIAEIAAPPVRFRDA